MRKGSTNVVYFQEELPEWSDEFVAGIASTWNHREMPYELNRRILVDYIPAAMLDATIERTYQEMIGEINLMMCGRRGRYQIEHFVRPPGYGQQEPVSGVGRQCKASRDRNGSEVIEFKAFWWLDNLTDMRLGEALLFNALGPAFSIRDGIYRHVIPLVTVGFKLLPPGEMPLYQPEHFVKRCQ